MSDFSVGIIGSLIVVGIGGIVALLWRMNTQLATVTEWMRHTDARLSRLERSET